MCWEINLNNVAFRELCHLYTDCLIESQDMDMGVDFKVSQSGEMPGILGVVHPDLHFHRGY